jgi:hypothetical protein
MKNEIFRLALATTYRLAVVAGVFGLVLRGVTLWVIPASVLLFVFSPRSK